jgi:flavin reductase (DIM6/NTAB) family NADH-FMN oxidoreductase RutF
MTSDASDTSEHGDIGRAVEEMPYGIYIIGSTRAGEPNGMIADWVTQVAFKPHRVAVSFESDAYTLENVRESQTFTVNLLAHGRGAGMALAQNFVQPHRASKVKGRTREMAAQTFEKLEEAGFRLTTTNCPILDDALMWLDCRAEQFVEVGDHTVVIAHVVDGGVQQSDRPLTSLDIPWSYSG